VVGRSDEQRTVGVLCSYIEARELRNEGYFNSARTM
jgi:hypothetical protein